MTEATATLEPGANGATIPSNGTPCATCPDPGDNCQMCGAPPASAIPRKDTPPAPTPDGATQDFRLAVADMVGGAIYVLELIGNTTDEVGNGETSFSDSGLLDFLCLISQQSKGLANALRKAADMVQKEGGAVLEILDGRCENTLPLWPRT